MLRRRALAPVLALSLLGLPLVAAPGAATPADRGPAPVVETSQPVAARAAAVRPTAVSASGRTYSFLNVDAGRPTRWNPCAEVPWQFNPYGAPAGGLAAVRSALAELSRQTGLRFRYVGVSRTVPSGSHLAQRWGAFKPVLVGWSAGAHSDLLRGQSARTVGMTRVLWTSSFDAAGGKHVQIASGVVAFNRATRARPTGPGSWYTYALHELGHAVGLAHVANPTQIMNPTISSRLPRYGTGDVAGLRAVGAGGGCLPAIR